MRLPGESRLVSVDGIRTHYVVAGEEGPPLLLIHGLGASVVTWQDNIEALSERCRVYAIDLPGHGDSDNPNIDYALKTGVRFLIDIMEALDIERPAIVGNSVGGLMALKLGLEHPERVSKLVAVGSAGLGQEVSLYVRLASLPVLGEIMESHRVGGPTFMLRGVFYDRRFATDGLVRELYRSRRMPGAKEAVIQAMRFGVNLWGLRKRAFVLHNLVDLRVPLLLVWGAQDQIFPVAHAYDAHREAPQARLKVFDQCGHWPHMEKAQEFNTLLLDFLFSSYA